MNLAALGGGLLSGIGTGMAEEAKAEGLMKREERLAELRAKFDMERQKDGQQFQAGEADKSRTFQAGQSELDRAFRSGESQKDRDFRAGESAADRTFRAGEGEKDRTYRSGEADKSRTWEREKLGIDQQNQLERIDRTADARERSRRGSIGDTSGLSADDQRQFKALEAIHGDDPEKLRAALVASGNPRLAALWQGGEVARGGGGASAPKAEMSADDKRLFDTVVQRHTAVNPKQPLAPPATDWSSVGRDLQTRGRNDLAQWAYGTPDPAPRDPAQRKVGQTYTAPDGRRVEWTGKGWRVL